MQSLSGLRLCNIYIDKSINSFAIPMHRPLCDSAQPNRVSDTRPSHEHEGSTHDSCRLIKSVSTCAPCLAHPFSKSSLVTLLFGSIISSSHCRVPPPQSKPPSCLNLRPRNALSCTPGSLVPSTLPTTVDQFNPHFSVSPESHLLCPFKIRTQQ